MPLMQVSNVRLQCVSGISVCLAVDAVMPYETKRAAPISVCNAGAISSLLAAVHVAFFIFGIFQVSSVSLQHNSVIIIT